MDGSPQPAVTSRETSLSMSFILDAVARDFSTTIEILKGKSRLRQHARARQAFYWIAYAAGYWSTPQIGRAVGGRDHTTILYGAREMTRRMETDIALDERIRGLMAEIVFHRPNPPAQVCPNCGHKVN